MTENDQQPLRRRLRVLFLLLGAILLIWLPIEDTHIFWVVLFGAAISALAAARIYIAIHKSSGYRLLIFVLFGLLAGLAITPVALFLMAFKSGIHGHGAPDFTPAQVTAVIQATPLFTAAGALIALGIGLLHKT